MELVDLAARLDLPRPTLDSALFWNDNLKWGTLDALIARDQALIFKYEDYVSQDYARLEDFLGVRIKSRSRVPKQFQRVVRSRAHGF